MYDSAFRSIPLFCAHKPLNTTTPELRIKVESLQSTKTQTKTTKQ